MSDTTELIDKNIDRLVEAIKQAGPSAEYGFQETLRYISMEAWGFLIAGIILSLVGIFVSKHLYLLGVKLNDDPICTIPFIAALFVSFWIVFFWGGSFPSLVARALSPAGYLVMQALN